MDEKNVNAHLNIIDGHVVLTFGEPVAWLKWGPDDADAFADRIKLLAAQARGTPTKLSS